MTVYLNLAAFKLITTMPSEFVDEVETRYPGWVDAQLEIQARWIDARLRKLYATPFAAYNGTVPDVTPPQIQLWLAQITTVEVWLKRGVDANDAQFDIVDKRAGEAKAEVLEASSSDENWFDLPKRVDEDGSLITNATTRVYSERSPYVALDLQESIGASEDENGSGSFG